jgi:hypothetical protein
MTPTPQRNVFINVYLPAMQISLGFVQAASFWLETPRGLPPAWRQTGVKRTVWSADPPPQRTEWK